MQLFQILLLLYISITQASIYTIINNTIKHLKSKYEGSRSETDVYPRSKEMSDKFQAQKRAQILARERMLNRVRHNGHDITLSKLSGTHQIDQQYFEFDPVLNHLKRRSFPNDKTKPKKSEPKPRGFQRSDTGSSSDSTSQEMMDWKNDFDQQWMEKKLEAINSSLVSDKANMAAARPWGVPCGDSAQYQQPWGTCMTAIECDAEFRIFRGDLFCGKSHFVCCAVQLANYDMYQGFDLSFVDSSFSTDTEEKEKAKRKENDKKKKKRRVEKDRGRNKKQRKRAMKTQIRKIVREMRKMLSKLYRNASAQLGQKTKVLKKYIIDLKKRFKQERESIKDIHRNDINQIDMELEAKLKEIKNVNKNFLINNTFREILINGTLSKEGARMLVEAYPELTPYVPGDWLRRFGGGEADEGDGESHDYLEYDIEYGALYY